MKYTDEELNLTEEEIQNRIRDAKVVSSRKYLTSTDWYCARKVDTGEEIPTEVVTKRTEAREYIRSIEDGK